MQELETAKSFKERRRSRGEGGGRGDALFYSRPAANRELLLALVGMLVKGERVMHVNNFKKRPNGHTLEGAGAQQMQNEGLFPASMVPCPLMEPFELFTCTMNVMPSPNFETSWAFQQ